MRENSYSLHLIPATGKTIADLPSALRREIDQRKSFGAPPLSELAARCFRNESRRSGNRVHARPTCA